MESSHTVPKTLTEATPSQQRDPDRVYKVKAKFRSSAPVTSRSADTASHGKGWGLLLKNVTCIVDGLESCASSTSRNVLRHSFLSINRPILRSYDSSVPLRVRLCKRCFPHSAYLSPTKTVCTVFPGPLSSRSEPRPHRLGPLLPAHHVTAQCPACSSVLTKNHKCATFHGRGWGGGI